MMRALSGRLCHGRPRRAREPHGTLAPLLRAISWGLLLVTALTLMLTAVAYALSLPEHLVVPVLFAGVTAAALAFLARVSAMCARPDELHVKLRAEPPW